MEVPQSADFINNAGAAGRCINNLMLSGADWSQSEVHVFLVIRFQILHNYQHTTPPG